MNQQSAVLSLIDGFGRIYNCGECSSIHLQVGAVGLTFSVDEYMRLVDLVNTSAANFERYMTPAQDMDKDQHS